MDFIKQFEEYSTIRLLSIIDNPNDYQPDAVDAAKTLLSDRQLSDEEIELARNELNAETQTKEQKERASKDKLTNAYKYVFDTVNPMKEKNSSAEKTIRNITVAFGAIILLYLLRNNEILHFIFYNVLPDWDTGTFFSFLPLVVCITSIILFYKKKRIGWFLLAIYLIYSSITEIWMLIMVLSIQPTGIESIDVILLPYASITVYIVLFIFYTGIARTISKENIRSVYSINKQTMIYTISITALAVVLMIYLISQKYI